MRVAEEMSSEVGAKVGYSIRFDDATSPSTRIKFLTDGMLIREALSDPLLTRYSVIMVDEAHERSISTDVLLGLLKKIQRRRPELRIVVSSATLQAQDFLDYFVKKTEDGGGEEKHALVVEVEGRTHPVDVFYLEKPVEDYVQKAVDTVFDIHARGDEGDILVFLTGRDEIEQSLQLVADRHQDLTMKSKTIMPLPLYAGLTSEQQMLIFDKTPADMRKVVFATNMAEASVTIDDIVHVIDSGFVKLRVYNAKTGIEALVKTPVSKASAAQRAGRAGRTRPGKCYRLYPEAAYGTLAAAPIPELQRSNLAPTILQLKALGIDNVLRFDFLSRPPAELMARALELLYSLGALDDYAKLTRPLGLRMAELAIEPMMAKTLLSASGFGVLSEILSIAAMASVGGGVWFHHEGEQKRMEAARRKFAVEEGDHLTLLNVYLAFITKGKKEARWCHDNYLNYKSMTRAVSIRNQLRKHLERLGLTVDESLAGKQTDHKVQAVQIRKCLAAGYFAHAARMTPDGSFRNVQGGTTMYAHPSSIMFHRTCEWVVFHEVVETREKIYIRDLTTVEMGWLVEAGGGFYKLESRGGRS